MSKISQAKIFKLVLIFFIIGIGFSGWVNVSTFLIFIFGLIITWFLIFISSRQIKIISLALLFFICGLIRYQLGLSMVNKYNIQFYHNQEIELIAQIVAEPITKISNNSLVLESRLVNGQRINGRVLINVPLYSEYQYGQTLSLDCKLVAPENFTDFNYKNYLAKNNIFSICQNVQNLSVRSNQGGNIFLRQIFVFKQKAQKLIRSNFSEPQGSLLEALLLGSRGTMPQSFRNWLAQTGTSHVVAISGLHIVILTNLLETMLFSFGLRRRYAFYLVAILIITFIVLTGLAPSAIRAGVMGLLLLYARKTGRNYQASNIIFFAAFIMLLINPFLLKWDIGFQLSFLSVLGLIYLSPYFEQWLSRVPNWSWWPIRSYLVATFSAYLLTLPLILYYFGNLSLSAPLVNIFILATLPWIMVAGLIFIISGLIWSVSAQVLMWPAWLFLTYVVKAVQLGTNLPFSFFRIDNFSLWWVIGIYTTLIIVWKLWLSKKCQLGL